MVRPDVVTFLGQRIAQNGIDRYYCALDDSPPYLLWVLIDARGADQFTKGAKWRGSVSLLHKNKIYAMCETERVHSSHRDCAEELERLFFPLIATCAIVARGGASLDDLVATRERLAAERESHYRETHK